MPKENLIEVYKQRYETFRHLDKLRWQMLQILVAIGSAFALIIRVTPDRQNWWLLLIIGFILIIISWANFKINLGIRLNGMVLHKIGSEVGDTEIPEVSKKWHSSSFWLSTITTFLAIGLIIFGFIDFFAIKET